jgi:GntR family transcriptional regulator/MocR family aminotransferase
MSKILSPSIRVGYVAASPPIIERLALEAALIDRQGDPATETAIAEMIEAGEVKRHTRRALKIYGERRGIFADLLRDRLSDVISFRLPDGGLAIWAEVAPSTNLAAVSAASARLGLRFYPGDAFAMDGGAVAGARLGFARLNPEELGRAVDRLRRALPRAPNR